MTSSDSTIIAQAVVTDPLETSAGGYMLVAKSPSILPQDADFLSASPGISDYLHKLSSTKDSYYSFFTLPSKNYALVRRFIDGRRRGVNRVVVHLLVLSNELLPVIQDNILLLFDDNNKPFNMVDTHHRNVSLYELGDEVVKQGIKTLPDIRFQLPENPVPRTFELLVKKREYLLKTSGWAKEKLHNLLIGILAGLVQGKRILLPQGMEYRELLLFAWLSLPMGDRRSVSWTTHFTSGRVLFQLANANDPNEARLLYPKIEECVLLEDIEKLARHAHRAIQDISERIITDTPEQLEVLYQNLLDNELSLFSDIEDIAENWHVLYSNHPFLHFLNNGASTLSGLSNNLSEYGTKAQSDDLNMEVLYGVCMTGFNLRKNSSNNKLEVIINQLFKVIRSSGEKKNYLKPTLVAEFINKYGSFTTALIAMELAWRIFNSYEVRDKLFSLFYKKYLSDGLTKSHLEVLDEISKQNPTNYLRFMANFFANAKRCGNPISYEEAINQLYTIYEGLNLPFEIFKKHGLVVLFGGEQEFIRQIRLIDLKKISFQLRRLISPYI